MKVKEMITALNITKAEFSRRYDIPLRTIENWCAETSKCPDYVLNMLEEKVMNDTKESKQSTVYTKETAKLMGEVYNGLLHVMNKRGNDPYPQESYRVPFRCIIRLLPRATSLGLPEKLNKKITELMEYYDPSDVDVLMKQSMPNEFVLNYELGKKSWEKE